MMQFGGRAPVPGVVYNTTMSRPDAALTLALLYGFEGKRESRVASIAISENSLGAAAFTDAVFRFYQLGPLPSSNRVLPVGLAADRPLPPDSEPVRAVLERKNEKGEPAYPHGMRRISDTAVASPLMRNSLTYFPDGMVSVLLSAPATDLARTLSYPGVRDLIKAKVRTLVISECRQDAVAMRRILEDWPSPVVFCGTEVGEALPYPGASIEQDFAWTTAHPVIDFYRASKPMPYDAPSQDLVAALYAVRPDSPLLQTSEQGEIRVSDEGAMSFRPTTGGKHRRLTVDPLKREETITLLRSIISAKPVPPPPRRRFTPEEFEKLRKQREEELKKREEEARKTAKPTGD